MTRMRFSPPRATALAMCLCLVPAFTGSPLAARDVERGMEPKHQPVVERTDFVFDVAADSSGALSAAEKKRLAIWFKALNLGYGDHVSLAGAEGSSLAVQSGIAEVVARSGLLVEGEAPATAGTAPAGGVRVVVSRSIATVPGCPTWHDKSEIDLTAGLSDNYGCATASNLAAMIADPQDLLEGREPGVDTKGIESGKAIKAYKDKAPTGAGGLQAMSAGG